MDFRQLKYFSAVAEEGHVGRAAERLHISQPPLTRQIKALESRLGVTLFTRTPRGMELTQAGQMLQADAQAIRGLVDLASERAQRAGQGLEGRIDIGLYGSALLDIVPRVLAEFRRTHPNVKVTLHTAQTPQQVLALRQGRVMLVFERMLPDEDDIAIELVAREPMVLALHEDHVLAQQATVDVKALRDEPLIVQASTRSALTLRVIALCKAHGFAPKMSHQEVSDVVTAAALVAGGYGSCLVPASLQNLQLPHLVYRPLNASRHAYVDLHCYYLKNERSPLLAELLTVVRKFRRSQGKGAALAFNPR